MKNNKIVGYIEILVKKQTKQYKVRKYAYLDALVIDKHHRRKGIANALLLSVIRFLKKKKVTYIKTNVYLSNKKAFRFFGKIGFKHSSMIMLKKV